MANKASSNRLAACYQRDARTIQEQIELLENRGMLFRDKVFVERLVETLQEHRTPTASEVKDSQRIRTVHPQKARFSFALTSRTQLRRTHTL